MIQAKFGDAVRSKTDTAVRNEVLAKILAHNLVCVQEMFAKWNNVDFHEITKAKR